MLMNVLVIKKPWYVFLLSNGKALADKNAIRIQFAFEDPNCIDTGAIAFMFNGGSSCASTIHPIDTRIGLVYLCY